METSATIVEAALLPHRTWRLPLLWREIWGPFQLFISSLRESKYASDLGNWYLGSGATFATASGIDVMLYEVSHRYGSHLYLSFLLMFSFPLLRWFFVWWKPIHLLGWWESNSHATNYSFGTLSEWGDTSQCLLCHVMDVYRGRPALLWCFRVQR